MRHKLFPTLLRSTASLVLVFGISYSYAQAYDAPRGSYAVESPEQYQRYSSEYQYRDYALAKAAQYQQSYAGEHLKYSAATPARYPNYAGHYGNEYSARYSDNYSNRYFSYTKDFSYSSYPSGGFQRRDYAQKKELPFNARYAKEYSTYQYGEPESALAFNKYLIRVNTATSIARYDSGLQMRANV